MIEPTAALTSQEASYLACCLLGFSVTDRFDFDEYERDILKRSSEIIMAVGEKLFAKTISPVHGVNCRKVLHISSDKNKGWLHDSNDDSAYSVDGVNYCGRCHTALT